MQSLLSASENNAIQSFLTNMDFPEDPLASPDWAMLSPGPQHLQQHHPQEDAQFYEDQVGPRHVLSRASKHVMELQPDRWREPSHYDYPRQLPQESIHHQNQAHYMSPRQSHHAMYHHGHHQQRVSSSSSYSYPTPPPGKQHLAYHPMPPPQQQHPHRHHHQHHSPSPGPPSSSASSQGFPPLQQSMSMRRRGSEPSPPEAMARAPPLRGMSPTHPSSSSIRYSLPLSPAETKPHPAPSSSRPSSQQRTSTTPPISVPSSTSVPVAGPSTAPIATPKQTLLSPSQKKANHIQSEQKRRANIRRGYEALCETVPALREAIRAEEEEAAERGAIGGRRKRKKTRTEDKDKIDGRAGPRSENVVLMKTIEHIQGLLTDTEELKLRLEKARSCLPPGHSALVSLSSETPLWEREWKGGESKAEGGGGPDGGEDGSEGDEGEGSED